MLKALTSDLLKYSADVSVRLKSVMEQSQEVETCSTAQLDKVMNAVAEMEASAQEQTRQARVVMADGAATTAKQVSSFRFVLVVSAGCVRRLIFLNTHQFGS